MSNLAHQRNGQLANRDEKKPTAIERILPESLRVAASSFYGFYAETLKGSLTLATRLKWWMQEESLTVDEAKEAMRRLMTPERSAEIDTSPKAIAALASEVSQILRDRRAREATAKRPDVHGSSIPGVRELLDRIGNPFADEGGAK